MKKGFTIVELLIVIVVIAILAAVVIVSYNGITGRAVEAGAKSDLLGTSERLNSSIAQSNGVIPSTIDSSIKVESGSDKITYIANTNTGAYCISVTNTSQPTTVTFYVTQEGTIRSGTCANLTSQVAGGFRYTLRVSFDGTVYAWGDNSHGQLGDGTMNAHTTPNKIAASSFGNKAIVQVANGFGHALALASDGTVYAWGYNGYGQLGDGTTNDRLAPAQVTGIPSNKTIIQVQAGWDCSYALASDGTLYAWGYNNYGQLGDGTYVDKHVPTDVTSSGQLAGSTITQIATSSTNSSYSSTHTLAVASGLLYAWGFNSDGELGDGTTTSRPTAVAVSNSAFPGKRITQLAAGDRYSVIATSDGLLFAWGDNSYGQIGDGTNTNRLTAVPVTGAVTGKVIKQLTAGYAQTLALGSDSTVYAWGKNDYGQLGNGNTTNQNSPVIISSTGILVGKRVIQVGGGADMSALVTSEPAVYVWGHNDYNQLGDGTNVDQHMPELLSF